MRCFGFTTRFVLTMTVVALALAAPVSASNLYLDVDSIPGDSVDETFRDVIDVLAVTGTLDRVGCAGAATLDPITIRKREDRATPKLFEAAINATNLGTVTLFSQVPTREYVEATYQLTDAVVTAGAVTHTVGDDNIQESWTIQFSSLQITYLESATATPVVTTISSDQCP